jgi:TrmH family RNA methyltransferase
MTTLEALYIESRQNPRLKELCRLWDRKHREQQGRFLIEGLREIQHAVQSKWQMDALFFCPELFPGVRHAEACDALKQRLNQSVECVRLSVAAFEKLSRRQGPDGMLAVARFKSCNFKDLKLKQQALLFIIEGLEKPGNLGAILRTADAAGIDAVIMVDCAIDLLNPNVIRASQGLVFSVPVVVSEMEPLQKWLQEKAILPVALTPHAERNLWQLDLTSPTAFVFGSEDKGLSTRWMDAQMNPCRIPMAGAADSLNVSVAAAVCAFEASRQRMFLDS